jgi:TonB family protein
MNQTGQVDLEIEIDAQGRVTKATPIGGPPIFHDAATQAVKKWRFKPATLDGNNVASHGKVTVVFNKR